MPGIYDYNEVVKMRPTRGGWETIWVGITFPNLTTMLETV